MILIVSIISFLLDGLVSNIVSKNGLFIPLFSLMAIVLIYPYLKKKDLNIYYRYIGIIGLLYDIVYTGDFLLSALIFIGLGMLVHYLSDFFLNNILNTLFIGLVVIIGYRLITYIITILALNTDFSWFILVKGIYSSLIVNILYLILGYVVCKKISKKHKIYRMN